RQGIVERIERTNGGVCLPVDGGLVDAQHAILACPARAGGGFIFSLAACLCDRLDAIPSTSSATVALGYQSRDFDGQRAGHGFLIPKVERKRLAACTFVDTKFSDRAPADKTLLRCFFGGAGDGAVLEESDESLVRMAREELRTVL